ncbi:Two-component sensor histidine kinase [Thermobacillus xylanilyticus]|uniref:histidine kinase n=1 Tax=Thermobacillus xylanilyticus TaxID=76633 RepID=A0ABM8V4E6_THEXY|nr:sensor histidine kinase [Thermobacillus xylanilyticus]CAG5086300.1 Two-component sensor histidine kinase [Thermobacillus xylanilyticus]
MRRRLGRWFREIAYKMEQWPIQQRLIMTYIVILLIPSLLISWLLFRDMSADYIDKVRRENESAMELERANVESNMETMLRAAELTYTYKDVEDYLRLIREPETLELMDIRDSLVSIVTHLQNTNPKIRHIRIFSDNENVRELYPVFWHESRISGEPWFETVNDLDGQIWWQVSPNDDELVRRGASDDKVQLPKMMLLREIEYISGVHAGVLEVDMRLYNFFPSIYTRYEGRQAQMAAVDRDGNLYYNRDNPWLAEAGVTEEQLKELAAAAGTDRIRSVPFQADGRPMLAVTAYFDQLDMHLINVVSLEQALRDMNEARNKLITAIVFLLVVLSTVTYFSVKLILKRLIILRDSMKKVRQGDFAFDIPVRGGGEVGELAHHFRKMLKKINELIADAVQKQAASKEAELRTLKNQIDSHFLYNTLENIKMLAEIEGQYEISDALTSLGGLMRYNLRWTSEYAQLSDELAHVANYIAIMNIRFERKIRLITDIPERFLGSEMLKLTLQPIVENAVKHGLADGGGRGLEIRIACRAEQGKLALTVEDDGRGMTPEQTAALNSKLERSGAPMPADRPAREGAGSGIGLLNVQQRIRLYYGPECGLAVESEAGRYTRVTMRLPLRTENGGAE